MLAAGIVIVVVLPCVPPAFFHAISTVCCDAAPARTPKQLLNVKVSPVLKRFSAVRTVGLVAYPNNDEHSMLCT